MRYVFMAVTALLASLDALEPLFYDDYLKQHYPDSGIYSSVTWRGSTVCG